MLLVRVVARNLSVSFKYEKTICYLFLALVFLGSRFLGQRGRSAGYIRNIITTLGSRARVDYGQTGQYTHDWC